MKFKRFISSVLAVAVAASLLVAPAVPAGAAYIYTPDPVPYRNQFVQLLEKASLLGGAIIDVDSMLEVYDNFTFPKVGYCETKEELEQCLFHYKSNVLNRVLSLSNLSSLGVDYASLTIAEHPDGINRIYDPTNDHWITDTTGNFPYWEGELEGDKPATDDLVSSPYSPTNQWLPVSQVGTKTKPLSKSVLDERCLDLNDEGHACRVLETIKFGGVKYYVIQDYSTDAGENRVYCNSEGYAYVAIAEPSATDIQYDYTINDNSDNSITVNDSQLIDIENGVLNLINDVGDKIALTIDSLTFDTGDKSYTINAYNTIKEGDTYNYTYYTYNITYNITNTYVTYIGSNDAYDKEEYQYYYQLPDGRSSADLTADEVAGMSFEFYDVVNYARSATDVSVRGLYHFDGDTDDSSYFSTQGAFEWTEGASITYMEAPEAFDGALYLDNTAHSFDVTLPSNLVSDGTIQFRYYQASEPDTEDNIDNYIEINGSKVLCWDEQTASRDPNGQYATWTLPVGTWNEIAIVRDGSKLYVYLNGLCVSEETYTVLWDNTISFHFGAGSRAFSMLDELRILNFALVEDGGDYTPTAVPYDSNLVLVLPDSDRPLADEHYEVISSRDNLLGDIYDFFNGAGTDHFHALPDPSWYWTEGVQPFPEFSYVPRFGYSLSSQLNAVYLTAPDTYHDSSGAIYYNYGFGIPIGPVSAGYGIKQNTDYTFSIIHGDGVVDSFTFNTGSEYLLADGLYSFSANKEIIISSASYDWGKLMYVAIPTLREDSGMVYFTPMISIAPSLGRSVDVSYIELVEGSSTDIHVEKKTAVYPGSEIQPNTAAVQSVIPVNGYTVGGVRPTLPARGDCWFPVVENRIQTCYIYTGTMWEEVGCRWYTGSRWIPIYAFDINTLEDLFDISDAADAVPPITSESGFWRWWQLQWLDFREYLDSKFDELIAAIRGDGSGSGSDCVHEYSSEVLFDATCTQPGQISYTCSLCGHKYVEPIDATGHDWLVTGTSDDGVGLVEVLPEIFFLVGEDDVEFPLNTFVTPLVVGDTYFVKWNGVEYICTATEFVEDGVSGVSLGDTSVIGGVGNGEPFILLYCPAGFERLDAILMVFDDSTEVTFSISTVASDDGSSPDDEYTELTCSKCGAVTRDYGDGPEAEQGSTKFSFSDLLGLISSAVVDVVSTVLKEFIGLIADLIKMFIQAVMDFIGGFVGVLSDATGHIATLGDNVAPIGDFVRGVYDAIPDDIEAVLTGSFVVVIVVSVISFLL